MRCKSLFMTGLIALVLVISSQIQAATWNLPGSGAWNADTSWTSPATFPNGIDAVANLTNDISGAATVSLNQAITIGSMTAGDSFAAFNNFTVATGTGTNSLTFDVTAGNATLTKNSPGGGNLTISAGVVLNDKLDVTLDDSLGVITISGAISGSGGIEKFGNGTGFLGSRLTLSGANTYDGDTVITGGRLRTLTSVSSIPSGAGKGDVIVGASGGLELGISVGSTQTINGLGGSGVVFHGGASPGAPSAITLSIGSEDATGFDFAGIIQMDPATAVDPLNRRFNLTKVGSGVQTLSGANTYPGTTNVSAGTLLVNGSHSPFSANPNAAIGAYTVATGATLGGTGVIGAPVNLSGTISPGVAVGTLTVGNLTQQDGATTLFELNPTDTMPGSGINDLIDIVGDLVGLDGTTVNVSVLDYVNNTDLAAEGTWTLAFYDSVAGTGIPTFNVLGVDPGYNYSVNLTNLVGPGAVQLTLTTIPEPGALALIVVGLSAFGRIARRK